MKKELENMQDAVNSINITEAMQKEIIQRVENDTKRKTVLPCPFACAFSLPVRIFQAFGQFQRFYILQYNADK